MRCAVRNCGKPATGYAPLKATTVLVMLCDDHSLEILVKAQKEGVAVEWKPTGGKKHG